MAKPFKIFLMIVGGLLALLVGAAIAVPLLFDPNEHRGDIAKAAKEQTGRDLDIQGDVALSLFPWLSVEMNQVVLGNAQGFGPEPFAQVARIDAGVRLLPLLFRREVRIGTVTVEGLILNLAKAEDGTNNWSDLAEAREEPAPEAPEEPAGPPLAFSVGGIQIKDAVLNYTDRQSGAKHTLDKLSLETGAVEPGKPLDLTLSLAATSNQPQIAADVKMQLTALADTARQQYQAQDLKLDVTATGDGVPAGKQEVNLRGSAIYDQAAGTLSLPDLVVEAVGVVLNASIQGRDLAGAAPQLSGKLASNTFSPREVTRKLAISLPPPADASALSQARFTADYRGDFSSARLDDLKLTLDQSTATGYVHVTDFATQAIQFALKVDALNADRYLAPQPDKPQQQTAEAASDFRQTPIPADALDAVNAKGTLEMGSLTLKDVQLTEVKLTLDAPKGRAKTQQLTGRLYGGAITQSARITPGKNPTYDIKAGLDSINAHPLLADLAGKGYLSGAGNFNLAFTGGGATVGDLLKSMDGALSTSLVNGALEGFNLKHTIAQAKSLAQGQPPAASDAPKRTEFSDLAASANIVDGVLKTKTLNAKGSDYTLTGDGDVNLVAMELDYVLKPTYTGGSDRGLTVPVSVTGSLFSPKVRVDLKGMIKDEVKARAGEELQKQEEKLKEKATEKLQDFFRRRAPKPEPAPPQPAPAEPPPAQAPAEQPAEQPSAPPPADKPQPAPEQ